MISTPFEIHKKGHNAVFIEYGSFENTSYEKMMKNFGRPVMVDDSCLLNILVIFKIKSQYDLAEKILEEDEEVTNYFFGTYVKHEYFV